MIIITVNSFSHRLTKSGQVVSAPLQRSNRKDGSYNLSNDYVLMDPRDMGLTSRDLSDIRQILQKLEFMFPDGYKVSPKGERYDAPPVTSGGELASPNIEVPEKA